MSECTCACVQKRQVYYNLNVNHSKVKRPLSTRGVLREIRRYLSYRLKLLKTDGETELVARM